MALVSHLAFPKLDNNMERRMEDQRAEQKLEDQRAGKRIEEKEEKDRTASVDAIETVQIISALLAGTGFAFIDDANNADVTILTESIQFFLLVFVGLNLYGLIVLSSLLFYLRQCLAKDASMFSPFMEATKDLRYWALKGVMYSMVSLVAVIGLRQLQFRKKSTMSLIGGCGFIGLALYCLRVMWKIRTNFAKLRSESKSRHKFKAAGHAVLLANKMKHKGI